jgi:hypothetical protein
MEELILGTRSLAGCSTVEAPLALLADLVIGEIFTNFNTFNHNPKCMNAFIIYAQDFK